MVDPQASSASVACEKEAERLFLAETNRNSVSTLAGMALLHVSLACHGEGNKGTTYLRAATQAAERMRLFGVSDALSTLDSNLVPTDAFAGTSAIAWGLFNIVV
jgi:hypothetical protein